MASTGLKTDLCYLNRQIKQSVFPMTYKLDVNSIKNCDMSLPFYGEAPHGASHGVSTTGRGPWLNVIRDVDVESILTQRTLDSKKCSSGELVDFNPKLLKLHHEVPSHKFLNRGFTHLSHPIQNYKGMSIDRFEQPIKDPQVNIFWDWQLDTRILQKDMFVQKYPTPLSQTNFVVPPRYKATSCNILS